MCIMHYHRLLTGITDMRPGKLLKHADRHRALCTVEGCGKKHWQHGYCRLHFSRVERANGKGTPPNLSLQLYPDAHQPCIVPGCDKKSRRRGFCDKHFYRIEKHRPLGADSLHKGIYNHWWKGGIAEYPDHTLLKKNRKQRLEELNYTCQICHGPATETHHLDGTKTNHDPNNLLVLCTKCHFKTFHSKPKTTSKYRRCYGMTLTQISKSLHKEIYKVRALHTEGKLYSYLGLDRGSMKNLSLRREIQLAPNP
jgi:hypothetical protein